MDGGGCFDALKLRGKGGAGARQAECLGVCTFFFDLWYFQTGGQVPSKG